MTHKTYQIDTCRLCSSSQLEVFLDLGSMPIPNGFLSYNQLSQQELVYPLQACVCTSCWLVQLTHVIPADNMFKNYVYIPSTSLTMLEHFQLLCKEACKKADIKKGDFIVDIGSNDGTLLSYFQQRHMRILGVDPAENLAKEANYQGIPTIPAYFTHKLAKQILNNHGAAHIITATNVIAHIHDLHDTAKGIHTLLHSQGLCILEVPYLVDLITGNEFDTIYHEHLSYFSLYPLQIFFSLHNLRIIDVQKQSVHGGTMRIYVAHSTSNHKVHPRVKETILREKAQQYHSMVPYQDFSLRVRRFKKELVKLLKDMKKSGKSIAAYGASAKGNILSNYCNLGPELLDYVVDSTPYKHGKYTPGTHIKIYPESHLLTNQPDYALLTSWNFMQEILKKNTSYRKRGGQFIVPVPHIALI